MGKTAAQRQREYRERHAETGERLNMAVSATTKRSLERMARHQGCSQREALERILLNAERALVDSLDDPGAYYDSVTA